MFIVWTFLRGHLTEGEKENWPKQPKINYRAETERLCRTKTAGFTGRPCLVPVGENDWETKLSERERATRRCRRFTWGRTWVPNSAVQLQLTDCRTASRKGCQHWAVPSFWKWDEIPFPNGDWESVCGEETFLVDGKTGLDGRREPNKVETSRRCIAENKTYRVTMVRCLCVVVCVSMRRRLTMNRPIRLHLTTKTQNGHFKTTNPFLLARILFTALCWSNRRRFHGHALMRSEQGLPNPK